MKKILPFIVVTFCFQSLFAQSDNFNNYSNSIYFTENKGQIHDGFFNPRADVWFIGQTDSEQFIVSKTGMSHQLKELVFSENAKDSVESINFSRVDMSWVNVSSNQTVDFINPISFSNYYNVPYIQEGVEKVADYNSARINNIYPGISVIYYSKNKALEYDYEIKAGSEYRMIQLKITGSNAYINEEGQLVLTTPLGTIYESAPIAFQEGKEIPCKWKQITKETWGFEVTQYNPTKDLVIDPIIKVFGSYFGGSDSDWGYGGTTDSNNNLFVSGNTNSTANIATVGAHQTTLVASSDAYIVKFNQDGVRQWATYYGSTDGEWGYGCSTDANGNVFLVGETQSNTSIATVGAHQTSFGGSRDGFLLKLNNSGIREWATYIGGGGFDYTKDCATDINGNVIICGYSTSTNNISTVGSQQVTYSALYDAFLVKFNGNGVRQWGTYCGGTGNDYGRSCSIDSNGAIILAGSTESTTNISTAGAHQVTKSTGTDGFIVKYTSAGVRSFGTYYGGTGTEGIEGAAIDATGNIFVTGFTSSTGGISTAGSHKPTYGGGDDAFVAKFSNLGVRQWGTYYGGTNYDRAYGCATDMLGNVFITGVTTSTANIATIGSHQTTNGGNGDAFMTSFSPTGTQLYGAYIGSSGEEYGWSAVVDNDLKFYSIGHASSTSTISTSGSHQTTFGGGIRDAYIVQYFDCPVLTQPISITGSNEVCSGISSLYTTTSVAGATHYLWEYTGMGILASDSLSVDFVPATTGTLSVSAINLCDTSLAQTIAITVNTIPNQPDTIFGLLEYCTGLAENYSVDTIANALSYTWTYNGTTLLETTENLAFTPATGDTLYVTANNTCGISTSAIAVINLLEIPSQPVSILGSLQVCNGNSEIYSVTQLPGVDSYLWEYSPVGVLSEISDSLDLTPTSDGILSVIASNSCGNSVAQTVNITIIDVPAQPTIINGATTVCSGISSTYSIDPILGAVDYTWEYSPVGVLSETTENLNLTPIADGILSVIANNSCGSSVPQTISITINEAPNQPNAIVGNANLCDTVLETYSIDPVTNTDSYTWTFSGSGDATSSATSSSFAPTSNGTLSVAAINSCGTSTVSELVISVTVIDTTVIDFENYLIAEQSGASYNWFSCNSLYTITGETNQSFLYHPNYNIGVFAVEITLNGCVDTSSCILVQFLNIEENNPFNNVVLYPNPTNESVTISNLSYGTRVEIVDVMGKLVFTTVSTNSVVTYPTTAWANGTYFVKISKDSDTKTLPLVVIH